MTDKYEANIKLISETVINKLIKYFLKNLNIVTKKIGKIKSDIEEAILDGKIENSYEEAYNYLISNKNNYIKK